MDYYRFASEEVIESAISNICFLALRNGLIKEKGVEHSLAINYVSYFPTDSAIILSNRARRALMNNEQRVTLLNSILNSSCASDFLLRGIYLEICNELELKTLIVGLIHSPSHMEILVAKMIKRFNCNIKQKIKRLKLDKDIEEKLSSYIILHKMKRK